MTVRARGAAGPIIAALLLLVCLAPVSAAFGHEAIQQQISELNSRIASHPREAPLYLTRGELHRLHGDWPAATRDYERAREIDPGLEAIDLCIGRMHLDAGHPDRAIEPLSLFLKKRPDHADALAMRARALSILGRKHDAVVDYTRAITAHSRRTSPDPDLFLERARALAASPAPLLVDALSGLDEGIRTLGPVVSLEFEAVDLEVRLGRFDAALARLERLAALSARKESYLVRRGALLESASRPDEARQAYADALRAIATLPTQRRATRAVSVLETTARAGLARLLTANEASAQDRHRGAR